MWLDVNDFCPGQTAGYGVSCPLASGKSICPLFRVAIGPIRFKLMGNEDVFGISD